MQHRITDPEKIEPDVIAAQHAAGSEVIVQFSKPCYTERHLRQLNELCERFTSRFQVRFYGHYQASFDCLTLKYLPEMRSLAVDCLQSAEHHRTITKLQHLEELSLGVYLFEDPTFLGSDSFRNLKVLRVSETKKRTLDLSPVGNYERLHSLSISGHDKGIEAIARAPNLTELQLAQIRNTVSLGFVSNIKGLTSLRLLLGGRRNIDEIEHSGLTTLSIIRVRGFESFAPEKLPSLHYLQIEDQIQLKELQFSVANKLLSRVLLLNCKGLAQVTGLQYLSDLKEIRVYRTAINFDALLASPLPPHLQIFAFYTVKSALDKQIRAHLDGLGYKESGHVT